MIKPTWGNNSPKWNSNFARPPRQPPTRCLIEKLLNRTTCFCPGLLAARRNNSTIPPVQNVVGEKLDGVLHTSRWFNPASLSLNDKV
jgi:hypothetical protein